jgi:uncharacterized damage-inducible protein DinB
MTNILLTLFDYTAWADARARAAIDGLDAARPERAQGIRLYAHLAATEHVWLARLKGRTPAYAIWPELLLEQAAELAAESLAALRIVAAEDPETLARAVEYRNSTGKEFRNTVSDILTHVALHGSYHRGQIARFTRDGGGTPAITDYIDFVRTTQDLTPNLSNL